MFLVIGFLAALSQPPSSGSPEVANDRSEYVAYVGTVSGKCVYQTGDVLMGASDFRDDLKESFDPQEGLILYHSREVPPSCLAKARRIVRRLGFHHVRVEIAPKDLDMGPPP